MFHCAEVKSRFIFKGCVKYSDYAAQSLTPLEKNATGMDTPPFGFLMKNEPLNEQ